jgi:CHAT domain-containing protein
MLRLQITYLPNLYLLISRRGQPAVQAHRDRALTAIGLGFEHVNPLDLPELPQSISEARQVAAIFNSEPVLDEQATKPAVIQALRSSRYVHISTHGRHNVAAPAFQCLYLSPDADSNARLFAYELLALDLRGLELLTLSACETALGRFDTADNLRGLPASFLLAGVATLIGTLWLVAVEPAESFFTSLYEQLKAGATRLEAFTTAQQMTRAEFPKYRHWGAFYLIGEWS